MEKGLQVAQGCCIHSIRQALLGHIPWLLTSFSLVLIILLRFVLAWVFPVLRKDPHLC